SEPLPDYLRWEHACTTVNIEAGEDIRWLPRTRAADLMLPGADCFVFDHRVVRWTSSAATAPTPATTPSAQTPGPSAISLTPRLNVRRYMRRLWATPVAINTASGFCVNSPSAFSTTGKRAETEQAALLQVPGVIPAGTFWAACSWL